jgi:hypothetical protein
MTARQTYFAYFLWTGEDAARLYALAGFQQMCVRCILTVLRSTTS